jgi:endonuclease YncB( thermonuclease family)
MVEQREWSGRIGRRGFLGMVSTALGSLAVSNGALSQEELSTETDLDALSFYSSAGQIAPDGESELTDEESVLVWAEPTAYNFETTDDGPETVVYEENEIPLISEDEQVVGIGTVDFVSDDNGGFDLDNEEFALNLFDAKMGGSGTVLWDEGHNQFFGLSLEYYDSFRQYAGDSGYDVQPTTGLLGGSTLTFPSTASQVAVGGGALTDSSHVVVWAEETAENVDRDGEEASHLYSEDEDIPLVSRDGQVVGFGTPELIEDGDLTDANEQFVLNLLSDTVGDSGTLLWDDAHDTFYDSSTFGEFADALKEAGYEFETADELLGSDEQRVLSADPTTPGEHSVHTWELTDIEFGESGTDGDEVNEITVAYENTSLDGLNQDDVTVTMTRTLSSGTDTSEIRVNQGGYEGATATFDLSGQAQTDVAGPIVVEIDGVENSDVSETATIILEGDAEAVEIEVELTVGDESENESEDGEITSDVLLVPSPANAYTDEELAAVSTFVENGGALFLFDESEFTNEETTNLNAIANYLDLAFRFNADQVEDGENNAGQSSLPTTVNFNEEFDVFEELKGDGLSDADGFVVPSPTDSFSDPELDALSEFVDSGGALFLLDESDFGGPGNTATGFDETENLNEIADALDLGFRFNSDQVNDGDGEFDISTTNFNTDFAYFEGRESSIGIDFSSDAEYYGRVVRVFDGDTFEVEFDSKYEYRDVIRHLGIDTAETGRAENDPEEWFGIEDLDYLDTWGQQATQFSLDLMAPGANAGDTDVEGRRVRMTFDEIEPLRGNFGRLLMYMQYDPDDFGAGPDGNYTVDYNLQTVEEGYARVYSSGFSRHDEFAATEEQALADGTGIWSAADFDALSEIRNDPVEELFVPRASSVTTNDGPLPVERAPVLTNESAEQEPLDGGEFSTYENAPLVGVDEENRLGMIGGILIHEQYEKSEGFPEDTSEFGNFPFFTNLANYLSANDGDFLIEGGHAQFDVEGSTSLERAQFYLRFIEGVGSRLRQFNDVVNTLPEEDDPTVVFLTAPGRAYTEAELAALAEYRDSGGAVVLLGSADASAESRANLDAVAAGLGSDLRLNADRVVDAESNLATDSELPVTSEFNELFPLFAPVGEMEESAEIDELVLRNEGHEEIVVGDVHGDVVIGGASEVSRLVIEGSVDGDLVINGASDVGELIVTGDVAGEVWLGDSSTIGGDVRIDGTVRSSISLRGIPTIEGDLIVGALEGELGQRGNPTVGGEILVGK